MKIADLHRGDYHFEGFFACGADGGAEELDIAEHFEDGLIEAEIADCGRDFAVFDQEKAVAGHAGHDFFVGVDFADVPEAGDEEATVGGGDHFFERRIAAGKDKIHGGFAVFVGESKTMAGRLFAGGFGAGSRVDEILRDAAIDEQDALAGHAFAIKRRAELQRDGKRRR